MAARRRRLPGRVAVRVLRPTRGDRRLSPGGARSMGSFLPDAPVRGTFRSVFYTRQELRIAGGLRPASHDIRALPKGDSSHAVVN